MEKIKLLQKLPFSVYNVVKEMQLLERKLERAGQQDLTRYIRYASYTAQEKASHDEEFQEADNWCENVVDNDLRIRQIMQRNAYYKNCWIYVMPNHSVSIRILLIAGNES